MRTDDEHRGARAEIEYAIGLWRDGARLLSRRVSTGWADDYERAVAAAVEHLGVYGTMTELVAAYFDDSEATGKDGWLAPLCHPVNGRELSYGIIEDTAFWRRAQELIAGQQGADEG